VESTTSPFGFSSESSNVEYEIDIQVEQQCAFARKTFAELDELFKCLNLTLALEKSMKTTENPEKVFYYYYLSLTFDSEKKSKIMKFPLIVKIPILKDLIENELGEKRNTKFYVLVGCSTMLITLGIILVFKACQYSCKKYDMVPTNNSRCHDLNKLS
jgi:hypothetical protein